MPSMPEAYVSDMTIVDTFIRAIDVSRWLSMTIMSRLRSLVPRNTKRARAKLERPNYGSARDQRAAIRIDGEVFVDCRYG